jgi:hypothetical protein
MNNNSNYILGLQYMKILIQQIHNKLISYKIVNYKFIFNYLNNFILDTSVINYLYNEYVDFIYKYNKYTLQKI